MAVRTHLVVHRTNDPLAAAFDRRVRLESQRGFVAAAVFDRTFNLWRDHRSDLPRSRKTLHTLAVLGSSYRRSGIAPHPSCGNARTRLVASHARAGSLTAYSVGVMPIARLGSAKSLFFTSPFLGLRLPELVGDPSVTNTQRRSIGLLVIIATVLTVIAVWNLPETASTETALSE